MWVKSFVYYSIEASIFQNYIDFKTSNLSEKAFQLKILFFLFSAIFPVCQEFKEADENTREFLRHIIEILLDFITDTNDRSVKVSN